MLKMKKSLLAILLPSLMVIQPTDSQAVVSNWIFTQSGSSYKYSNLRTTTGSPTYSFNTEFSPFLGDKQVKVLDFYRLKSSATLNFEYNSANSSPWKVSLDMPGTGASLGGDFTYRMSINSQADGEGICATLPSNCGPFFGTLLFDTAAAASNPQVRVFQANGDTPGAELTPISGGVSPNGIFNFTSPYNDIIVNIAWASLQDPTSMLSQSYTQVPAPLPILATATFFGTLGKIRRLSAKLHTESEKTSSL